MQIADYTEIKAEYARQVMKRDMLLSTHTELESSHILLCERVDASEKASHIIHHVAQQTQQNLEFHVSTIVTSALRAIDPGDWPDEFIMRFVIRGRASGSQSECNMYFKEGGEEYEPELGSGGGPLDVASFALRIAYWSLKKNRPTFIFDEPFKYVSPDLQNKTSEMVKMLCDKLGIQIILISHAEDIEDYSDKEFRVSKVNGRSLVKEIRQERTKHEV